MHIPRATYRVQLSAAFDLNAAAGILDYLHRLGVSDLYLSPVFAARPGSSHGYDVVDYASINPELGGPEALERLSDALGRHEMFVLQDIVPNHMAFDRHNRMLMDVLEKRERSPYRDYFDIDWHHPYESLSGRVLAPFLGRFYGRALDEGEIRLVYDEEGLGVRYYDHRFPLSLDSYLAVFGGDTTRLEEALGAGSALLVRYLGALYYLGDLVSGSPHVLDAVETTRAKRVLRDVYESSQVIAADMDRCVAAFNGISGVPGSFDRLDGLLAKQFMRLSFWKVATEEVNYRRFFTINDLICLRVELPEVFEDVHALVFGLADGERIAGLRVDHIDGLLEPEAYLKRLRARCPGAYVVVEKVLGMDEQLPGSWPVQGTTGYDFLGRVTALFCDNRGKASLTRLYGKLSGENRSWSGVLAEKKRLMVGKHMAGTIDNLAHMLVHLAGEERYGRDITLYALRRALVQLAVYFPHYRGYVGLQGGSADDHNDLAAAFRRAREEVPELAYEYDFIESCFARAGSGDPKAACARSCLMHFQQLTGPLMAKGGEDTAFYTYNRLLALNEVGGDPGLFGITPDAFHQFVKQRAETWPHTLNATATHDTKRGEDMRMRLVVLSEMPAAWGRRVRGWVRMNRRHKHTRKGESIPDVNDEYHLYQTLVGAYPPPHDSWESFVDRIKAYMIKAVREAKVHTAWIKPDTDYEQACAAFVDRILDRSEAEAFLGELQEFAATIAHYGRINSLAQLLLKMTVPGVPDFYQGSEGWDLSLVDPDNRRSVDFAARRQMVESVEAGMRADRAGYCRELLEQAEDGRVKLFLTLTGLRVRRGESVVFETGDYVSLSVSGGFARNVVAFVRRAQGRWVLVVVPRLTASLVTPPSFPIGPELWRQTRIALPQGAPSVWTDEITGEIRALGGVIEVGRVLERFPVALLAGSAEG